MLTTTELAQMRADIAQLLPDTCDVLEVSRASDGAGGWADTWGTVAGGSALPCRLDFPNPGKESVVNATLTPFKSGMVSLAYDKAVTTANRLSISGVIYNVTGVNSGQSWIAVKRVSVERVP